MGDLISSIAAFLTFGALCACLGWMVRDLRAERQQDRAEEARDAAWDAAHDIGSDDDR